jgi:CRISPR/Cas system CMR subunit Cmr4 (Cas7 group RAMP superfamily)
MTLLKLKFILKSDATFGRGDGVAGLVDSEVQHDEYGLPFLGGRALKGLLEEECANIVFALQVQKKDGIFIIAAKNLFGCSGSSESDKSIIHIGDARFYSVKRSSVKKS